MLKLKRVAALILCVVMVMTTMAGCGGSKTSSEAPPLSQSDNTVETGRTTPLILKYGQLGSGREGDILGYPSKKFIELVEAESNGMLKFEFYPDQQLGSEQSMLDQLMTGTLDFAPISTGVLATIWPDYYIYSMPFAFPTYDQFWAIDAEGGFDTFNEITGNGVTYITSFSCAYRGFSNTIRPIRTVTDMKGITFRIMSGEIYADTFAALGSSTANVPFGELYTALQQGVIDAEDNGMEMCYDRKFYEVEDYHTQINMLCNINALLISEETEAKLTDNELEMIWRCAHEAEKYGAEQAKLINDLYRDKLIGEGMEIVRFSDLTAEEFQTFLDATKGVWEKYEGKISPEVWDGFIAAYNKVN